jgi:serine/threonine protein kinase
MTWPQSQDFNEAIQNPRSSFGDSELRGGQAAVNTIGMPMPRSGNFADVYEFHGASGQKWAIKCFTRHVPGLQDRYAEISKHLDQAKFPFTVDFSYLAKGIRIRGECYPILKMQWVEGFLLNEFVRDNLDRPVLLESLGQIWARMASRLREAGIAHGDLQHGNVILVPGSTTSSLAVKLIDYDGMFVPALASKKSGEMGHANYQHPERLQQGIYSAEVDRLSFLAIACALRCLAVGGKTLWDKYDNGDNILFRETDLRNPTTSALFKELWKINDPDAHELTGHLVMALIGPFGQVPSLQDLLSDDRVRPCILGAQGNTPAPVAVKTKPHIKAHPIAAPFHSMWADGWSAPGGQFNMLSATRLMDTDFAQWRLWGANARDRHPEGHPVREKALMFCSAMNAWHTTSAILERRPLSEELLEQMLRPLKESIDSLVADLMRLGVSPPEKLNDTKVQKNTRRVGSDQNVLRR